MLCKDQLSYTRCRELFKECLKNFSYNEKIYGLYSLRSSGITTVVKNNHNISEILIELHGRWKSDAAKDMYVLKDASHRLSVTESNI